MNPVAERTSEQRLVSLQRANEVRRLRAQMKRHATIDQAVQLLELPPYWLSKMAVAQFLTALPGWGERRALVTMRHCHIIDTRTIGALTARQRGVLAHELRTNGYQPHEKPC